MALIDCNFSSEVLDMDASVRIIMPEKSKLKNFKAGEKYKVLYLLHGIGGDQESWTRKTSIERYVMDKPVIVIMPSVGRSFYTDMKFGSKYWTFISEELPKKCEELFGISTDREDNFVAGLSMGGYGAFKLALNCPDKFKAAASLSGALDLLGAAKSMNGNASNELVGIFGSVEEMEGSINDLIYVAKKLNASEGELPKLYQWCGTEDFLYSQNVSFRDFINKETRISLNYNEGSGDHQWHYWDEQIQIVLKEFGL